MTLSNQRSANFAKGGANQAEASCITCKNCAIGKSTALRCMDRLETTDAGTIRVCGHALHDSDGLDLRALRKDVGIVFQSYNLFPHMTALQNITLAPRSVKGVKPAQAREQAMQALAHVGLADKADAYPVTRR
ncbi:ATP-binding cassette domain-containing protein [Lactiplantibacillus plantarum]|uniref:ATP-binding cassette domain-containing protein n=1 Tax=Lactiplantibacillus plantarum TaxID=1590 RepID=UPI004045C5DF